MKVNERKKSMDAEKKVKRESQMKKAGRKTGVDEQEGSRMRE